MLILPRLIDKIITNSVKFTADYFADTDKLIIKFIGISKGTRRTSLFKKRKTLKLTYDLISRFSLKVTVINTV